MRSGKSDKLVLSRLVRKTNDDELVGGHLKVQDTRPHSFDSELTEAAPEVQQLTAEDAVPSGPRQQGRGKHGQYEYWITMPQLKAVTTAEKGVREPEGFTREEFSELIVQAHKEVGVVILETAVLGEPHASGKARLNCRVRAKDQFREPR